MVATLFSPSNKQTGRFVEQQASTSQCPMIRETQDSNPDLAIDYFILQHQMVYITNNVHQSLAVTLTLIPLYPASHHYHTTTNSDLTISLLYGILRIKL